MGYDWRRPAPVQAARAMSDEPRIQMPHRKEPAEREVPYWAIMSVLFSSHPLEQALAMTLCDAAFELHRGGGTVTQVSGDFASGRVTSLGREAVLGAITGPSFEARLDTARGATLVRFLITRPGLEILATRESASVLPN